MSALALAMTVMLAQPAQNVVVVAIDGVRPREVFDGAQRELMHGMEEEAGLAEKYWRPTVHARRSALMPFLWNTVAREGQLFGNAELGSPATVQNEQRCSYPGYNEMLTGSADPRIDGNGFGDNPNRTVLEHLAAQPGLEGKVQAFATWDTFFRIFNVTRSKLDVRAGLRPPFEKDVVRTSARDAIDSLYRTTTPVFGGNALDALTFAALKESLRTTRPRVLFLGLGEHDEWMHAGRYDLALESLRRADARISELWTLLQSMPEYRGTTALIITTDHGRGLEAWREHGRDVEGAQAIFMGVYGAGVEALGERVGAPMVQGEVASLIAALLGHRFGALPPPSPFEPRAYTQRR